MIRSRVNAVVCVVPMLEGETSQHRLGNNAVLTSSTHPPNEALLHSYSIPVAPCQTSDTTTSSHSLTFVVLAGFGHGFSLEEKLNRPTVLTEDVCHTVLSDIDSVAPGTILKHIRPPSPIAGLVGLSTTTETQLQLFTLFDSTQC